MYVRAKLENENQVLFLFGDFDQSSHGHFARAIFEAELTKCKNVILDLSNVSFMDHESVEGLCLTYDHLEKRGIELSLRNPSAYISELINDRTMPSDMSIFQDDEAVLSTGVLV
jgi:anti-anti-sigma factor